MSAKRFDTTGWIKRTWSANASLLALGFLGIGVIFSGLAVVQTIKLDDRHFYFQWGNAAEWFAAVGTVATLVWLVINAIQAENIRAADRKRADEIQAAETTEKQVDQARRISGWISALGRIPQTQRGPRPLAQRVILCNSSAEAVYEVVAYLVWVQGNGPRTGEEMQAREDVERMRAIVQVLPPGNYELTLDGPTNTPTQGRLGLEVALTDGAGRHWVRRAPTGNLEPLVSPPVVHYGIGRPLGMYTEIEPWK